MCRSSQTHRSCQSDDRLTASGEVIAAADVRWDADQCLSATHGDRYFSTDAEQEVARVFIDPVELRQRLQNLHSGQTFTCGELGFGTGLNAVTIAEIFLAEAPADTRLHLISTERAPLSENDMGFMAQRFCARLPLFKELSAGYPPLITGWHRMRLAGGRVVLSIYFGNASDGLSDIAGQQQVPVNHWLLDGFAPRKNPSLWRSDLFEALAGLSTQGTTLATYSAAGEVRRALMNAGFSMRKVDQMPIKLHSLAGEFNRPGLSAFDAPTDINVIGSGIAGACTARSLAERGIRVRVIDELGQIAGHASRIPAAVLHPRLRDDGSPAAAWQALSSHYSHQRLTSLAGYQATGAQQICGANNSPQRLQAILDRYNGSGSWLELHPQPNSAFRNAETALRFNIGGVVHGPTLCRTLLDHPLIELTRELSESRATVLANGIRSQSHPAAGYLEIAALAGQAELCSHPAPPSEPIVGAGYLAPCRGGMVIGSTYEYRPWKTADAINANLAPWKERGTHRGSFRGFRTITSDRLCIVGDLYTKDLEKHPGLKIATGFGSTGMSSAPLAGECIASELTGEFAPIAADLRDAISSARFRHRQARRGPRMNANPD